SPVYGGGQGLQIAYEKQISTGCSCNSVKLSFPNHVGTHVDMPYHFIQSGKKVADYEAHEWIFEKIVIIDMPVIPDEIITLEKLKPLVDRFDDIELLLIKTHFEQYRDQDIYWQHSPGFSEDIAL